MVVSILVLLDMALMQAHELELPKRAMEVSILVLLDMALMLFKASLQPARLRIVSILVLLDMALMHESPNTSNRLESRFNPCFTGYGSDAGSPSSGMSQSGSVSILVLLDMALMLGRRSWRCSRE